MVELYFSDILNKIGVSPKDVKLIRHALSDKGFRSCYEKEMVIEYTSHQRRDFSKGHPYWAVFISDSGNSARFYGLFRVGKNVPDTPEIVPDGFPHPEWFQGKNAYYELSPVEEFDIYRNRLLIDWGSATKMWHQKGTTDKEIIALRSDPKKAFPGFDCVLLGYDDLKDIFEDPIQYADWKAALSSVNAIYLISDTYDGRLYVGSAYGKGGLWGRWNDYATTGGHGHNTLLQAALQASPDRSKYWKWSILQILPKNTTAEFAIQIENLWKDRLLTRSFGYNKSENNLK